MMNKLSLKKWLKFCIVGAIGMIPNFIVFKILSTINYDIAWFGGVLAGATSNYILNSYYVFIEA